MPRARFAFSAIFLLFAPSVHASLFARGPSEADVHVACGDDPSKGIAEEERASIAAEVSAQARAIASASAGSSADTAKLYYIPTMSADAVTLRVRRYDMCRSFVAGVITKEQWDRFLDLNDTPSGASLAPVDTPPSPATVSTSAAVGSPGTTPPDPVGMWSVTSTFIRSDCLLEANKAGGNSSYGWNVGRVGDFITVDVATGSTSFPKLRGVLSAPQGTWMLHVEGYAIPERGGNPVMRSISEVTLSGDECWFRKLWPVVSRNSGRI